MPNIFKQGDWGKSLELGMNMRKQMDNQKLLQEQAQQRQAEFNMKMEEFKLKLQDQKQKREDAEKLNSVVEGNEAFNNPVMKAAWGTEEGRKAIIANMLKEKRPVVVPAGATVIDENNKPVFTGPQKPTAPTVRTFTVGDTTVEKQWNPTTQAWDVVSSGPRYKNSTTVINNIGNKGMTEIAKSMGEQIAKERPEVEKAALSLKDLEAADKLLNSSMITGKGAEWILGAGKALQQVGYKANSDPIRNTEAYMALMGKQVGQIIKQFGSGTGLSDADREYAEKIAAGKITLEKDSMKKIVEINKRAYTNIINLYNSKAKQVKAKPGADQLPFDLEVPMPKIQMRTGKFNGRNVIEYSDGSIEYVK